ncbi:MAG: hypothetical protein J3Q66DRAFT_328787 [Benniella sp.]|nr:MAG: hypothetical protein J3Q66DRAFT_328787 [Benniella sp.]
MVKLRVSVGGSYTDLAVFNCNDELHPIEFDGPEFKGRAVVRIKDFVGITSDGSDAIHNSDYFKGHNRRFSIQVEGRFKHEWRGDQVYFGTDFDNSVHLPHGFDTMFKFAQVIDPVVKSSLSEEGKPWILSPLVSSITTMTAWLPQNADLPSPPHMPRYSSDTTRSSHESSSWGLLGKLKRGHNHHGSTSSVGSYEFNESPSGSASSSTEHLDHAHGTHSRTVEPSPLSSTPASAAHTTGSINDGSSAGTDGLDDSDFPLGYWRQHLEEDTTFFMPDKHSMNTARRRSRFQSEEPEILTAIRLRIQSVLLHQ